MARVESVNWPFDHRCTSADQPEQGHCSWSLQPLQQPDIRIDTICIVMLSEYKKQQRCLVKELQELTTMELCHPIMSPK